MTPRLRLAATAILALLVVLGLQLIGAHPAAAASGKPRHRAPVHEPVGRPRVTVRKVATAAHKRRERKPAHAGGLILAVRRPGQTVAHAAADPFASIVDFSFSPATITIHVGDTITWTNVGHQPHTATANSHSFNTGILRHGQSGSHTFTAPGTYTYYCIVHPFMKGTIVVLANTTTTTSTSTTTTPTTTSTTSTSGLPNTGLGLAAVVVCGVTLAGLGLALRRRLSQD